MKPVQDLKQTIIDGQRLRLSQLHDACQWCVDQLTPFMNMGAIGPLESFRLKEIERMLNGEKVSGEAKTPDSVEVKILDIPLGVIFTVGGHRVVGMADNKGRNFGVFNADEPFVKLFPKEGGSVPTPSDEYQQRLLIELLQVYRANPTEVLKKFLIKRK